MQLDPSSYSIIIIIVVVVVIIIIIIIIIILQADLSDLYSSDWNH